MTDSSEFTTSKSVILMDPAKHGDGIREGRKTVYSFAVFVFICVVGYGLLYGPTIVKATFLGDDWFHVEKIPSDRISHLFFGDWHLGYRNIPSGGLFRPLPRLLMQLGRYVFDLQAPGYLLFSAFFHILNAAILWWVAFRLSDRLFTAWTAALFFAFYPTHPEPLLQVSTLADSMAVCGVLTALLGNITLHQSKKTEGWLLVFGGVALGALSKESWVTLPLLVIWFEWVWRFDRKRIFPERSAIIRAAIFVGFGVFYVIYRQFALGGIGGYPIDMTFASIQNTFNGTFQLVIYPFCSLARWNDLINVYTLLGGMIIVWAMLNFPRFLLFGMGWMVLTPLPFIRLIPHLTSGRLVYIVVVGYALFVAGALEGLLAFGKTPQARRNMGLVSLLGLAIPLIIMQQRNCADWRRSFRENHRLVQKMADVAAEQSKESRFAVLNWPAQFGAATSNRQDSAAKAISMLSGIDSQRVERLLPTDAAIGTITFTVTADLGVRLGRVEAVQIWNWTGDQIRQWEPQNRMQLVHSRSDGSLDYWCENQGDVLLSPDIAGFTGYYTLLTRYRSSHDHPARILWGEPDCWTVNPERMLTLSQLPRNGEKIWGANLGWLAGLQRVFFFPSIKRNVITIASIEIARFQIGPLDKSGTNPSQN